MRDFKNTPLPPQVKVNLLRGPGGGGGGLHQNSLEIDFIVVPVFRAVKFRSSGQIYVEWSS